MKLFKKIKPFHVDDRGEMIYLIEGAAIQSVLRITCRKGSIRANHIHAKDTHYSYMEKGSMNYYYREGRSEKSPIKRIKVKEGEMVYTSPLEAHAMKFLEESVFLTFTTERRNKGKYETDLKRVELIK